MWPRPARATPSRESASRGRPRQTGRNAASAPARAACAQVGPIGCPCASALLEGARSSTKRRGCQAKPRIIIARRVATQTPGRSPSKTGRRSRPPNAAAADLCAGVSCEPGECDAFVACDSATGECLRDPWDDFTPCSNGVCQGGVCKGARGGTGVGTAVWGPLWGRGEGAGGLCRLLRGRGKPGALWREARSTGVGKSNFIFCPN